MKFSGKEKDSLAVNKIAVVVPANFVRIELRDGGLVDLPLNNVGQSIVLNWNVGILLSNREPSQGQKPDSRE